MIWATRLFGLAVAALLWAGSAAAEPAEEVTDPLVPAQWGEHQLSFGYTGFTSIYSCNGLRSKVSEILLALGARKRDLSVTTLACGEDPNQPTEAPSVSIHFASLERAPSGTPQAKALASHWQPVDVATFAKLDRGDCELVEQVEQSLLPLFTRRDLDTRAECIPGQASTAGPIFRLRVLKLDTPQA